MPEAQSPMAASERGGLSKQYRPSEVEPAVRARWESSSAFHAQPGPVLRGEKRPYSIVIPPPNVTANLHLGHALNNTLQDVLIRAHRMMGFEALWMPGTDHAGIATQTVVDRRLREAGEPALADYKRIEREGGNGREAFVAKVQAWKDEYERRITEQLRAMGCSCDWSRQRFTMDEQCAAAVREAFFRLFGDGLIYRGKRLVNWDPVTQTALADDEVEMREVEGRFYYLRYPLVHPSTSPDDPADAQEVTWSELAARGYPGAERMPPDDNAWLTVATTRPETYLGDTAVAVNPRDARALALRGLMVQLPLVGRIIPIVEDDYVVMPAADPDAPGVDPKARFATGFLKVTPAHDANDYEIYRRHRAVMDAARGGEGAALINVMAPDATISDAHGWSDPGDAGLFVGRSREEARTLAVREFRARGLLEDEKPYVHSVGHSYRSHAAIEPYLSDQWYVRVTDDRLAGSALRAMDASQRSAEGAAGRDGAAGRGPGGSVRFTPDRYARTYELWHENIRDWCISRQLWWGHRIPVWSRVLPGWDELGLEGVHRSYSDMFTFFGLDHAVDGIEGVHLRVVDRRTGEELSAAEVSALNRSDETVTPGRHLVLLCITAPEFITYYESRGFVQDPDVLDTWFSSALWPMSTMGWPAADEPGAAGEEGGGLLRAFNPTSVLCTAREIITLWVSRMVMFNRYFLGQDRGAGAGEGPVPFRDVFIHAMIQDGEGRKMSKSLGNGVDPLDIIASHGADAMRFTLCHMTTHTQDVRMPVERDASTGRNTSPKFDFGRNFCNKVWNAARFTLSILDAAPDDGRQSLNWSSLPRLEDRWMLSRLRSATLEAERALREYEFSSYAQALYDLIWRDFCDWYLEAIKPTVREDARQRAVLRAALDASLRLLHPVVPFITEAIFEELARRPAHRVPDVELSMGDLLCASAWPMVGPSWADPDAEDRFDAVRNLVTAIREVRAQHQVPPKKKVTLHAAGASATLCAHAEGLVETLALLDRVTEEPPAPGAASTIVRFGGEELRVSGLADGVDASAERARLEKRIEELSKQHRTLDGRLSSPGYVDRAPAALVEQTRAQLAAVADELASLRQTLERLG